MDDHTGLERIKQFELTVPFGGKTYRTDGKEIYYADTADE